MKYLEQLVWILNRMRRRGGARYFQCRRRRGRRGRAWRGARCMKRTNTTPVAAAARTPSILHCCALRGGIDLCSFWADNNKNRVIRADANGHTQFFFRRCPDIDACYTIEYMIDLNLRCGVQTYVQLWQLIKKFNLFSYSLPNLSGGYET